MPVSPPYPLRLSSVVHLSTRPTDK